jgi:hypothetical protein
MPAMTRRPAAWPLSESSASPRPPKNPWTASSDSPLPRWAYSTMPKLVTTVVRSTAARRRAFPQLTEREREALAVLVGGGYLIAGW